MSANSRLTVALHILTRMAFHVDEDVMTSDQIANSVKTNPVVIRRILGLLGKEHLVTVQHGTGAGWRLARRPEEITLLDVYQAVEHAPLFELHHSSPSQTCRIGIGIRPALEDLYASADIAMKQDLARSTVADVLRETLHHYDRISRASAQELLTSQTTAAIPSEL